MHIEAEADVFMSTCWRLTGTTWRLTCWSWKLTAEHRGIISMFSKGTTVPWSRRIGQ